MASIPELITDFSKQNVNYGMAVGQSLQKLGQQVGETLAMQEYQKQAASMAPMLGEAYKTAYTDIALGTPDGLARGMGTLIDIASKNPQIYSNPILSAMNQQAAKYGQEAADLTISMKIAQLRNAGGGSGGMSPEQIQKFLFNQGQPDYDTPVEELPTDSVDPQVAEKLRLQGLVIPPAGAQPTQPAPAAPQAPAPAQPAPTKLKIGSDETTASISPLLSALTGVEPTIVIPTITKGKEQSVTRSVGSRGPSISVSEKPTEQGKEKVAKAEDGIRLYNDAVATLNRDSRLVDAITKNGIENYSVGSYKSSTGIPGIATPGSSTESALYGPGFEQGYLLTKETLDAFERIKGFKNTAGGYGIKFSPVERPKQEAKAAPKERMSLEEISQIGTAAGEAKPAAQRPAKQLTLQETLAQEAASGSKPRAREVTPQQKAAIEKSRISQQKSDLESQKKEIENLLYNVQRSTGKKQYKAGLSEETISRALTRIKEIDKAIAELPPLK